VTGEMYVARFSAWACGIDGADEWNEWALGRREINRAGEGPAIDFTSAMFRRRLSQISKMTVRVVHDLLPLGEDTKMIFISFRGELNKQYSINRMVIEDNAVMPAAFSLSVFNAPIALASMAFNLKGGYSAVYPARNSFCAGLAAAGAALFSEKKDEVVVVYADEAPPPEYSAIFQGDPPLAFALLLTRNSCSGSVPVSLLNEENDSPQDFLKRLLLKKEIHVSF